MFALVAFDVTVGLPATPSALEIDRPVPDTASWREAAVPLPVRTSMPVVAMAARAVRSASTGCAPSVFSMVAASASSSSVRA